ncbi:TM2 domain-containing protein [Capnocytophaga canis]|uniref:TM2 domain-containing protein n=1 Tax=Capnocytophaga canis TaxID=1848903 RepID=UPI001562D32D|nr:TM2 domain-containing protein [Capnocytophaga canis]
MEIKVDANKVDMFIVSNGKYFKSEAIPYIRKQLSEMNENQWVMLQTLQFKDPQTALLLSLLTPIAAVSGIDRIFIGDVGLGVAKILTCGGLGIWTIVDWFLIMDAARDKNFEMLQNLLRF